MKKVSSTIFSLTVFTFVFLGTNTPIKAQKPDWLVLLKQHKWLDKVSSLELLKTNRVEAEKILGEPEKFNFERGNLIEHYSLKNGRVTLTYTKKECTSVDGKIARDTIERISFQPEAKISFSNLKLSRNQFRHSRENDNSTEHHFNEKEGVDISVQYNVIHSINFEIPEQKNFSCVTVSSFLNDLDKIKSIKLLESNRDEVRKVFAEYENLNLSDSDKHEDTFFTGDARFIFSYSQGCPFYNFDGYDVNKWNVEGVKILPVNSIKANEFGIDLTKYKKEKMYNDKNSSLYIHYDKNLGVSFQGVDNEIWEINFFPSQKYNSLICDKEKAKVLSSTESIFTEKSKDRVSIYKVTAPYVEKIYLSKNEIVVGHNSSNSKQDNNQKIEIFTRVLNPENNVLTYNYIVTVGKIIGRGEKVVWDLSGVKAGTYTITAAVDDGCGFCGKSASNTIIVK